MNPILTHYRTVTCRKVCLLNPISVPLCWPCEAGANSALCSSGLLKQSDWEVDRAAPPARSKKPTWAPCWGMGDLVRCNTEFLGVQDVIAHLESLSDKASNDRRRTDKAKETGLGFNQMIEHVGHTAREHVTDAYARVNAAAIAAAQEQMKEHGRKHGPKWLENGSRKRLRQTPDLLAMTGLDVTDDTPLEDLVRAEIRLRAVVHADKLLADPGKIELVKEALAELKFPAQGFLTFAQRRQVSYWADAVVAVPQRLSNTTQLIGTSCIVE